MADLKRIENKTFGPNETVTLDGCVFINCIFDGCDFVYGAEADTAQINCTSEREQTITFCGAAQRTLNTLKALGFTVTDPFGKKLREESLQ